MMISLGGLGKGRNTNGKESGKNPSLYRDIKAQKIMVFGDRRKGEMNN